MGDVYTTDYPAINPAMGGTSQNVIDDWNYALDHFIGPNTKIDARMVLTMLYGASRLVIASP